MKTESVMIRMTPEMKQQLIRLAEKERRSVSDLCRIIIEDKIKKKIKFNEYENNIFNSIITTN